MTIATYKTGGRRKASKREIFSQNAINHIFVSLFVNGICTVKMLL